MTVAIRKERMWSPPLRYKLNKKKEKKEYHGNES